MNEVVAAVARTFPALDRHPVASSSRSGPAHVSWVDLRPAGSFSVGWVMGRDVLHGRSGAER